METIDSIMKKNGHKYIDILKLDIEGSEFSVLRSLNLKSKFFGQLLIEFHDRFIKDGLKELYSVINLLHDNGFLLFAISEYEYSFINKTLYGEILNEIG